VRLSPVADERLAAAVISSYCRRRLVEELSCTQATGESIMHTALY
jgi:hypothetical protein